MRSTISIRSTTLVLFLVFFAMLFHCAVHAQTPAPKPSDALPAWTASSDQLSLLDAEVSYAGFKVQPPSGYKDFPLSPDSNMTTSKVTRVGIGWKGPQRDDGSFSLFIVQSAMFVTAPKKPIILRELLNKELTKGLHTYKNVSTSSDEEGFLNGVACARAYWKGKVTDSRYPGMIGPLAHGFIYVTWNPDTKTVNWIEGEDIDPDYSQTSKAMEAAALTLKPN